METHKAEPMSFAPVLAILVQLENVLGDSTVMLKPTKILEFLIHLKSMVKHVGDMIGAYNALAEEHGRALDKIADLERRLLKHENDDTPPRAEHESGTRRRRQKGLDEPKKRQGGQWGHKGTTLVPEANRVCTAEFLEKCECGEHRVTNIKKSSKDHTLVGYEVKTIVTTYEHRSATCVTCGKEREWKFYHRRIMEKSPVPAPAAADPPVREREET